MPFWNGHFCHENMRLMVQKFRLSAAEWNGHIFSKHASRDGEKETPPELYLKGPTFCKICLHFTRVSGLWVNSEKWGVHPLLLLLALLFRKKTQGPGNLPFVMSKRAVFKILLIPGEQPYWLISHWCASVTDCHWPKQYFVLSLSNCITAASLAAPPPRKLNYLKCF